MTNKKSSEATDSREQFDRQAANYAASTVHRQGPSLAVLIAYAEPSSDDIALDIATGTGNAAFAMADCGASVVGLDISTGMLAKARERADAEGYGSVAFDVGSAENIPFPDGAFSLVVVRHAPHHFRDVPRFLAEVRRVLRPDGRFVMADQIAPEPEASEWIHYWQNTRDTSHYLQRSVEEWQELADLAGFVWVKHTLVPYRMDFDWWVGNSGTSPDSIRLLREHAKAADSRTRGALWLEFGPDGDVKAFTDQILVVRMEPK